MSEESFGVPKIKVWGGVLFLLISWLIISEILGSFDSKDDSWSSPPLERTP